MITLSKIINKRKMKKMNTGTMMMKMMIMGMKKRDIKGA